jgi:hypothetical protein
VVSSRRYSAVLSIRDMDRAFKVVTLKTQNMAVKSVADVGRCDHLIGDM